MKAFSHILSRIAADLKKHWAAIVLVIILYGLIRVWFSSICPSVRWLGLPCPGCGMTRAFAYMLRGQWHRAWSMNPMVYPVALYGIYLAAVRYVLGRDIKKFTTGVVILCICMLVSFGIRMYYHFPDRIPYVYTNNNVLAEWVPGYGQLMLKLMRSIRSLRL